MMKTCSCCIHASPETERWTGNGYTVGCNAVPDNVHPVGHGNTLYNQDGSVKRDDRGMILVQGCKYYKGE
jgi:hypothetical protein